MMTLDVALSPPLGSLIDLDATFLIQWGIFLITAFILNVLVFKPLLRLEDLRRARTTGAIEHAHQMERNAKERAGEYTTMLTKARLDGTERLSGVRETANSEAQQVHNEARSRANELLEEALPRLQTSYQASRTEMQATASKVSELIVSKVLGAKS